MAFAQLTYRESLRDIETCLLANQTKLHGFSLVRQTFDAGRQIHGKTAQKSCLNFFSLIRERQ
jgi:hypothetical protein